MALCGADQAVDSRWGLWDCGKFRRARLRVGVRLRGPVSIIGFRGGGLCQVFRTFFWFGMSGLGDIRKAEGLDNFGDEGGEAGFGGLGVGREVEVAEGLGGDGADGDTQDLRWKTEA
jgi:hypothetical protein